MGRRPRIDFCGAIHHVTGRGVKKRDIYLSPIDRMQWLAFMGEVCGEFGLACLAYCQMNNHYHVLLRSEQGALSKAMQRLNGRYGGYFNSRHDLTGHVLQGRFHAELVDRDAYLLEVIRYVLLNPVRAGMVGLPTEWVWSSCLATLDLAPAPPWLDVRSVRRLFGLDEYGAVSQLEHFLHAGIGGARPSAKSGSDPVPGWCQTKCLTGV